jgi:acetylornithine/succinyldiaminopimelate/putrescine aminotransferase
VFFCNSGTEATEGAMKFARCVTGRQDIVYCDHGFHGLTMGSLALNGADFFRERFGDLMPGTRKVPFNDLVALEEALATRKAAAFIVEPVQGKSCEVVADGYLAEAQRLCRKYGTLLVLDEVQCGLGRTGTLWAYEDSGVVPDALTTAKALGGGLPIGALICGPRLGGVLEPGDHGSTFAGGPVPCAAGLAVMDVVDDPALLASVRELGARLAHGLSELPGVVAVRGRGLMLAADFDAAIAPELVKRALTEQRLVLNATGPATLRLLPPLTIGAAEADDALARLRALL